MQEKWIADHSKQAEAETLGRMGGPEAGGPGGSCVCPECGYKLEHNTGQPCYEIKCPQCGTKMTREASAEEQKTLGRMGGPEAGGPGGTCVCPDCGYKMEHDTATPCSEIKCPQCGVAMTRKPGDGDSNDDNDNSVEEQSLLALTLSLPTILRVIAGKIAHFNHVGEVGLPLLEPVSLICDGVAYAKAVLSTPHGRRREHFLL